MTYFVVMAKHLDRSNSIYKIWQAAKQGLIYS